MDLVAPADQGVSVAVYDAGRHPALARFFENPESARLARYSIVLTNESNRHIVGVALRWIVTDHDGQSRTRTQSFDSFGTSVAARQPVIPTGTQLIATPNGFQHANVPSGSRFFIGGVGRAGGVSSFGFGRGQLVQIDDLDEAQAVKAVVDTVIFEDGRIIGTDESHLVDYINAIAAAVKTLIWDIRDAMSNGRDVDDLLRNIVSMRRTQSAATVRDDPASSWAMREAQSLLGIPAQQRMGRLDQLERLPPPPAFHR